MAVYAKLVADILKLSQKRVNPGLLALLKKDSDILAAIEDDFAIWLRKKGMTFQITCFFEDLELLAFGAVVTKDSARLPGYTVLPIEANHMGMARFKSARDTGYQRILGELTRWLELTSVTAIEEAGTLPEPEVDDNKSTALKEDCLRSLHFPDIGTWEDTVDPAMPQTFTWAWTDDDDSFATWAHSKNQLYWVRGKPGSGKSTFLKDLVYRLPSHHVSATRASSFGGPQRDGAAIPERGSGRPKIVIAGHFLRFDGSDLSRSLEGILRSWLWQISTQREDALREVMPHFVELQSTQPAPSWSLRTLYKALISAIKVLHETDSSLFLFLDALNESNQGNLKIAKFCLDLLSKDPTASVLRLCVSSRVDAEFSYEFRTANGIVLEDKMDGDIRMYVTNMCSDMLREPAFHSFVDEIISKACGVFLWVKLASSELQRGWRRGKDKKKMTRTLKSLPERLASLYRQILDHMDVDDREDAIKMLSVAVAAVRPLTLEEFQYSFEHGCGTFESLDQPIHKRVAAICSGLLEIRHWSVFLAHETVLEFFVSLQSEFAQADNHSLDLGSIYLYNSCVWRLRTLRHTQDTKGSKQVFASYAVIHFAKHVDAVRKATSWDRDVILPMSTIPVEQWLLWKILFCSTYYDSFSQPPENDNYAPVVCGLLVLASSHVILRVESRLFHTISAVIAPSVTVDSFHFQLCGSLRAKVSCHTPSTPQLWYSCRAGDQDIEMWSWSMIDIGQCQTWPDKAADVELVESMDSVVFTTDHELPANAHLAKDTFYLNQEIVRLAVVGKAGIDPGLRRRLIKGCGTPLHFAAHNCFPNLVSLLLFYGADPNMPSPKSLYGTALNAAIYGLPPAIQSAFVSSATGGRSALDVQVGLIKLLLDSGADPNAAVRGADTVGPQTPLEAIIRVRRGFAHQLGSYHLSPIPTLIRVLWMLLQRGARPNISTRAPAMGDAGVTAAFNVCASVVTARGGNPGPASFIWPKAVEELMAKTDLELNPFYYVPPVPVTVPVTAPVTESWLLSPTVPSLPTLHVDVMHSHAARSNTTTAATRIFDGINRHLELLSSPVGRQATVSMLRPYANPHH